MTVKSQNFNRSYASKLGYGSSPKVPTKRSMAGRSDVQSGFQRPDLIHTAVKNNETLVSTRTDDIYMAISEKK
jgi:hypothetical protein